MAVCKVAKTHKWNPGEYNANSSVQYDAAMALLKKHKVAGTESVLDVGCGDGKITAEISNQVPLGKVHGIDISSDMISFAKEHFPAEKFLNLTFETEDAAQLNYSEEFDIVFSSFVLQWIKDHKDVIERCLKCLKPKGFILFSIPLGISKELESALRIILKRKKWFKFFPKEYQETRLLSDLEWKRMIVDSQLEIIRFDKVNQKMSFHSLSLLEKYVTQWLPHIYVLPEKLRPQFKEELFNLYSELTPEEEQSGVCFSFPRLDIIGKKT
ncbi:MAG: methyltransferase domain-containing protein [Chlamydiia bacterium]|nr:methyltransferase domain-containing protein [Chlamydiia bacterium]